MDTMKSQCQTRIPIPKRELKFYFCMLDALYSDVADAYPASVRSKCMRDLKTIKSRVAKEGYSFLTKTLPSIAKAIDKALATDTPLRLPSVAKRKGSQLPKFLGWLIEKVFDTNGRAIPPSDETEEGRGAPYALLALRQLLYAFYKLELPYDKKSVEKVLNNFTATEADLAEFPQLTVQQKELLLIARGLVHQVFAKADPFDIIPKHGPGSVASGETAWQKVSFKRYISTLHESYPHSEYMYFNQKHYLISRVVSQSEVCGLDIVDVPLSKAVFVPKDSRGPRLISMELPELQFIQQGLKDLMVETLEAHSLTQGHVNFTCQRVNQVLALQSSRSGSFATMDMKDASDRVHLALVAMLFPLKWAECLDAARSHGTRLPDGKTVLFNKFAPMGSATCFPVLATVIWALSAATLIINHGYLPKQAIREVFVYGDDLIVPTRSVTTVTEALEAFGLKVNGDKCCYGSHFRESCGVDAYNGVVVTPLRLKRRWSGSPSNSEGLASYVALSNAMYARGFFRTAGFLEKEAQAIGSVPYTAGLPDGIQFVRPNLMIPALNQASGVRTRYNRELHRYEAYGWRDSSKKENRSMSYHGLLAKWTEKKFSSLQEAESLYSSSSNAFAEMLGLWETIDTLDSYQPFIEDAVMRPRGAGKGVESYARSRSVVSKRDWLRVEI
jgi:hypothetical protein